VIPSVEITPSDLLKLLPPIRSRLTIEKPSPPQERQAGAHCQSEPDSEEAGQWV
jgi:hypothetical protein